MNIHESHSIVALPVSDIHVECENCWYCTCHHSEGLVEACKSTWANKKLPLLTVDMILAKAYSIPSTYVGWRIYTVNLDDFRYQVVAKPLGDDKFEVWSVRGRKV
ncbi:hypothetical protein SEA_LEWANDO_56 [Arthrobacter phage Lewando]|nr:hypothetical protein SEA_LEWANDO_56 [Arthrobacter phage Lewando]